MAATPFDHDIRRDERAWQDETGWSFQERAHSRAGTRYVLERQFERLARFLDLADGSAVLDLGCGTGCLLDWLARRLPGRWTGVDLSRSALRRAGERNPALLLCSGDAERLPLRGSSFDAVVCNGAAHHFLDLDAAMREVYRLLKPGARVILFEPVATRVADAVRRGWFRNSRFESPADLAHKHEFTRGLVEETLLRAGFTDFRTRFFDFLAYPLTGMYMPLPWSGWRLPFRVLWAIESGLDRSRRIRPLLDSVSWRLLMTARRPTNP
ncbi:MAG TPA: class I SAM-dependent methyltransferase [Candidatus Sulfotelmatobacter sp.]|nr:class I SAM-dependent methyltransferase [Candidatus Sulfotelmatobacter sp.]